MGMVHDNTFNPNGPTIQFQEEDRIMVAVTDETDPDVILLGMSGYDLRLVYDKEKLNTVNAIQNAAHNLVVNLTQMLLDDQLQTEREAG